MEDIRDDPAAYIAVTCDGRLATSDLIDGLAVFATSRYPEYLKLLPVLASRNHTHVYGIADNAENRGWVNHALDWLYYKYERGEW